MIKNILGALVLFTAVPVCAQEITIITPGAKYQSYSERELKQRIWHLERAVNQLQNKVYQLEARPTQMTEYTCRLQAFGKTYTASSPSESKATARVLQKCSDNTHSMHCKESKVKCGT